MNVKYFFESHPIAATSRFLFSAKLHLIYMLKYKTDIQLVRSVKIQPYCYVLDKLNLQKHIVLNVYFNLTPV